ncbi:MAG: tetratricopeptide repeat protein [Anaerolineales bacterium]|nr:tetratricopeptide repeat protein [Anaerolineales bacterium]
MAELKTPTTKAPWPNVDLTSLPQDMIRPWLLPAVYERLQQGLGDFLAELRPTVALFLRFDGIDYDSDAQAGAKLDGYLRWLQSIVMKYEGTLIDLNIGDKGSYVYVNFGAPVAHENNAAQAAATALALVAPPEALNFVGPVRIGISQGRMRAGAYGGTHHRTYGVLGDEVNLAARLMMAAQPGQILVSQSAQPQIAAQFSLRELPPIRVKGKSEPVRVYALHGNARKSRRQMTQSGYRFAMIGRSAEMSLAEEKLALAANGHGQIIGVTGDAGIGKSRLVADVIEQARTLNFEVYRGECESFGVNSNYLVWHDIWRSVFDLDPTWNPARQIEHLKAQVSSIAPGLLPRLPLLSIGLQLDIPDNDLTASLDAKTRKGALEGLLVEYLARIAERRPMLIVLEDCHWLDPLSHDLLVALGSAAAELSILFLYVFRPFELKRLRAARVSALPYHTEILLQPLTPAEAARFVRTKVGALIDNDRALATSFVERITMRAEGNPYFLDELLNYLQFEQVNFHDPAALDRIALPDSIQSLVLSLIDRFSESQKITVKIASVIGRIFHAAWLTGSYPQLGDPRRVNEDLAELERQELILQAPDESDLAYTFRQAITQSVTYESLPYAMKAHLHEQIGAFLETAFAASPEQVLDLMAFHYDCSGKTAKRRDYLRRAGEAAQAVYANLAAIDYYTRALPLQAAQDRPELLMRFGQVLELMGEWHIAAERYAQALAEAENSADAMIQVQALIAIGEIQRKQGRFDDASGWFTRAGNTAALHNDLPGMAKVLICRGTLAAQQGDYGGASIHYASSLAVRRALDDRPNIANVLNNMAIVAQFEGDYARSQQFHEEALAIRRELGNTWAIAMSLNNLGTTLLDRQNYSTAGALLAEALVIQRAVGDKWAVANVLNNLGNVRRELGQFAECQLLYAESLALNHALGDQRALAYLLEDVALLAVYRRDFHRGLRLMGAAQALRNAIASPLSPAEQENLDSRFQNAQDSVGNLADAILAEGRNLTLPEAVAYASTG